MTPEELEWDKKVLKQIMEKHPRSIVRGHAELLLRNIDQMPELHEDVQTLIKIGNVHIKPKKDD